ncbi:cytochrome P450 4C1-like isoform X2 [Xylocopa sonorina]|uniref:cytochrome P450 4C1-like isoform X2 n=1 Tax=Xylocopa sonorina TaxID=1818115 RepID=UPI00403B076D
MYSIILLVLFIIFSILLHHVALHYGSYGRAVNSIPGPWTLPIFGNAHLTGGSSNDLWKLARRLANQYYPIYRFWVFSTPWINICHPDDIALILGNPKFIYKSYLYKVIEPWFGDGIGLSSGNKWQVRRKMITPAFHMDILQQFVDTFAEKMHSLIETMRRENGSNVVNVVPLFVKYNLDTLCETLMGTSIKDKREFQIKYHNAVDDIIEILIYRLKRPWLHSDALFNLTPQGRRQYKLLKTLHDFPDTIIQERKEYYEQSNDHLPNSIENSSKKNLDIPTKGRTKRFTTILDILILALRDNLIDEHGVREEINTFMLAGHETTSTTLSFAVMLFAEHPEIQARARAEVESLVKENNGKLDASVLQNLSYLDMCLKETLRLYPSGVMVSRTLETDITLHNYKVPANTTINVHIFDVHRDPRFWPDPDVYDPDRFLPEKSMGRHPYCYIPFSSGRRACIGQKFAMMQMKTTLALLLFNFILEPVENLKNVPLNFDIVLRPAKPLRVKFIPRVVSI